MDVYLKRTLRGLEPADDQASEAMRRFKVGDEIKCKLTKPRSTKHHRMYFGLLQLTFDNQERYTSFEMFRKAVQIEAGHVDELIGIDGVVYRIPRSIAWDSLDQLEFEVLFPQVMSVCAGILRMESSELSEELSRYAA